MIRIKLTSRRGVWYYRTRRAAFRGAKRKGNVPMSQRPKRIVRPRTDEGDDYRLDHRNIRLYIFDLLIGGIIIEFYIREDKEAFYGSEGYQSKHFNAGKRKGDLKDHHYWEDD